MVIHQRKNERTIKIEMGVSVENNKGREIYKFSEIKIEKENIVSKEKIDKNQVLLIST